MSSPIPAHVVHLGLREYGDIWQMQRDLVAARQAQQIPDTLLLCEHPDVITLGRGTHKENVVNPGDLPIFEIERGGDVTYHGPGQLVGYPILQLRPEEQDLHRYLRNLEEALILAVGELGLTAGRNEGWTGIWTVDTPPRKLASIGVAVKRGWVTLHGFALNVSTNLAKFASINPCGLEATVMTSVSACLGRRVAASDLANPVTRHLGALTGRHFTIP